MIKFLGSIVPYLIFHVFCCGFLLIFLISSGILLLLSQEGENKTLLLPAILLGIALFWLHGNHGKCCEQKGYKTSTDWLISILLYISFSMIFGLIFMIYLFIPWWIPNYQGGPLLP